MCPVELPITPNTDGIVMWFMSPDSVEYAVMGECWAEVELILAMHGAPTKIELTRNTY
jgi:hypothetical protein